MEHYGASELPFNHDLSPELIRHAQLYIMHSDQIQKADFPELREIGHDFLASEVGDRSFRLRFGVTKPTTEQLYRLVEHFLRDTEQGHTMLLLIYESRLLGAASIFSYPLRDDTLDLLIDTDHVVELSVTVADELQGQGLGQLLLEQARDYSIQMGKTHAYFGFMGSNDQSRHIVDKLFGSSALAAGKLNPYDKFYRLVPYEPTLEYLEFAMKRQCGEPLPDVPKTDLRTVLQEHPFGQQVIKIIDIVLPKDIKL